MEFPVHVATTLSAAATLVVSVVATWASVRRNTQREVDSERQRLTAMMNKISSRVVSLSDLIPPPSANGDSSLKDNENKLLTTTNQNVDGATIDRFTPLLIEYYAYGLVQAKRHSMISLTMSTIGGFIILAGVVALIWRAQAGDSVLGAALSAGAGLLTNAIGVLFHRQSNQALKHMQEQTVALRDDMRKEREAREALEQLEKITSSTLKDRLRTGVVLRFSGAELPDLGTSMESSLFFTESDAGVERSGTKSAAFDASDPD